MSSKRCGLNVGISWYLVLSGSYFWGGNPRGENNESSTTLRYNRCNREDTARILTLPKSEDFRLRLAAKMITAKIETLTVILMYLVLIETV